MIMGTSQVNAHSRYCQHLALITVALLLPVTSFGQITALTDSFESGSFSSDWDSTTGSGTAVVFSPGNGGAGSDRYARIQGVGGGQGGLGLSLADLTPGSPSASDFTFDFDLRVDSVSSGIRQFSLIGSATSATPNTNSAHLNIRYQDSSWWAYDGSWQTIPSLGAISPGNWNQVSITGNNWGSGVIGNATYDIQVTDHLGSTTSASGLQFWQNGSTATDNNGIMSFTFNDTYGSNPGYDIDNVVVTATPAPVPPTTVVITPTNPVAYSGIYPHTAVTNTHPEVGVGGIIKRGNTVYYMTYGPHITTGGSDELYSLDLGTLEHTTHLEYPGNTDANRYRDNNLGIDVIGAAYIDSQENIRFLPVAQPGELRGRITGTSAHLTDPNKLYYMTMEEGLYEVDFSDLDNPVITTLRVDGNRSGGGGSKNLPGVHGKGLFTGQGNLYFTNNGAGEGFGGGLVEWDGTGDPELLSSWTVVDDTSQYTEVTSRQGPVDMDPSSTDAIWATGWDDESMFINTRDAASGTWTKYRLPQSSYTHGHPNGWYTEWPRVRDVGLEGGLLMSHHGMMFLVPETFSSDNPAGIKPLTTHHKMIVDYVEDGDQIIFAANDASRFSNGLVQKANSNIQFVDKSDLAEYGGRPSGFGGVWVNDTVNAGTNSDAFLIGGFHQRVIHFEHEQSTPVDFVVEIDQDGSGVWTPHTTVTVPGTNSSGYASYLVPSDLEGEWVRFRPTSNVTSATVYLHMSNGYREKDSQRFASLVDAGSAMARSQGLIRSNADSDYKLEFAADILDANGQIVGTGYYEAQLNPTTAVLELVAVNDASSEASVRSQAATTQDFGVDAASVFIDDGGTRYRLPKGNSAFDTNTASGARRGMREVVTERELMNIHGTFYELPRNFAGGGIERIRPITTHNQDIFDFASWRGMLVLSGIQQGGAADGHYVESSDGNAGLWFGNVDDLWSFGAPQGEGGPWKDSAVTAGTASDAYLMTGYDNKELELSHTHGSDVDFLVEVDILGTGQWEEYGTLTVGAGQTLSHIFDKGYSAHWVRLTSSVSTTATAWFTYTPTIRLDGDYNGDGVVNAADYTTWRDNQGKSIALSGDRTPGAIDLSDYDVWVAHFGDQLTNPQPAQAIPEPTALVLIFSALAAVIGARRVTN